MIVEEDIIIIRKFSNKIFNETWSTKSMEIKIKYRNDKRNEGEKDTHRYKSTDCGKDKRI